MTVALLVSHDPAGAIALARGWVDAGASVSVVLLDAAVAAARQGHADADEVRAALGAGISVTAHGAALARRGVAPPQLVDGLKVVDIDEVADLVADGADKVVWL